MNLGRIVSASLTNLGRNGSRVLSDAFAVVIAFEGVHQIAKSSVELVYENGDTLERYIGLAGRTITEYGANLVYLAAIISFPVVAGRVMDYYVTHHRKHKG